MNKEEMKVELKKLIGKVRWESYLPEYRDKIPDEQVLGVMVSTYAEWDGDNIMKIFTSALEDANYHTLNAKIKSMYKSGLVTEK